MAKVNNVRREEEIGKEKGCDSMKVMYSKYCELMLHSASIMKRSSKNINGPFDALFGYKIIVIRELK